MHFVFLFLHVAPLRSSVARPSSKTNTEAFVIVSRSLMAPLPCFLSTSGQLDLDLDLTFHSGRSENVLGGQFETHEYFHHPGVEDALAVFMGCAFFKLFFSSSFLASLRQDLWFSWMPLGNPTHGISLLSSVSL